MIFGRVSAMILSLWTTINNTQRVSLGVDPTSSRLVSHQPTLYATALITVFVTAPSGLVV